MDQEIARIYALHEVGPVADQVAKNYLLQDYHGKLTEETRRRQRTDLAHFEAYLLQVSVQVADPLYLHLAGWAGMSWGIVEGFKRAHLAEGFAIGTVNVRLATVKAYCTLAHQAGILDEPTHRLIAGVKAIGRRAGRNLDETREITRRSTKKAEALVLSQAHVQALKAHLRADTSYIGRRDLLLLCLLVDHGLRCGEVVGLRVAGLDLAAGIFTVYRHKVDKFQTHLMTGDTLQAARRYIEEARPPGPPVFEGFTPGQPLTARAINKRVGELGRLVGITGLSPHDLRHTWATRATRKGTPLERLRQAGGWAGLSMPLRYIEESAIANEGVIL